MIPFIFTAAIIFIIIISINTWKRDELSQESNKDIEKEKEIDKQVQKKSSSIIKSENNNYRSYSEVTISQHQKACNIINYYEKRISTLDDNIENLKENIEKKNDEIKEIKDKIKESKEEIQEYTDDIELNIDELEEVKENLKEAEKNNNVKLIEELKNDIEEKEFDIELYNDMIESCKLDIELYNDEIENLQFEIEEIKTSIKENENDIKNYKDTIEDYEQQKKEYLEFDDDENDEDDKYDDYNWSCDTNSHNLKDNIYSNKKDLSYEDYITVSGSFETYIVGNTYEGRQEKFEKYVEDTYGSLFFRINEICTIYLESEPDNPYDKNAIKVMHNEIGQLGYIPKDQTKYIRKFCPLDKMKIYFYAKYYNDNNKFYTNLYLVNNENGRCGIEIRKQYKNDDDYYINVD